MSENKDRQNMEDLNRIQNKMLLKEKKEKAREAKKLEGLGYNECEVNDIQYCRTRFMESRCIVEGPVSKRKEPELISCSLYVPPSTINSCLTSIANSAVRNGLTSFSLDQSSDQTIYVDGKRVRLSERYSARGRVLD